MHVHGSWINSDPYDWYILMFILSWYPIHAIPWHWITSHIYECSNLHTPYWKLCKLICTHNINTVMYFRMLSMHSIFSFPYHMLHSYSNDHSQITDDVLPFAFIYFDWLDVVSFVFFFFFSIFSFHVNVCMYFKLYHHNISNMIAR